MCIARIGSYRILVGLGDVYVSPDPETRYDMALTWPNSDEYAWPDGVGWASR